MGRYVSVRTGVTSPSAQPPNQKEEIMFDLVESYTAPKFSLTEASDRAVENMDNAHGLADTYVLKSIGYLRVGYDNVKQTFRALAKGQINPQQAIEQAIEDWNSYIRVSALDVEMDELNILRRGTTIRSAMKARIAVEREICIDKATEEFITLLLILCQHGFYLPIYDYQMQTKLAWDPTERHGETEQLYDDYADDNGFVVNNIDQAFTEMESLFDDTKYKIENLNRFLPDMEDLISFGEYALTRTFHTTTTEVMGVAALRAAEYLMTARYKYVTERDEKVCELCEPLDGKILRFADRVTGLNFPHIHPGCRCQVALIIDGESIDAMLPKATLESELIQVFIDKIDYEDWLELFEVDIERGVT